MLDVKKLHVKIKLQVIALWIESLQRKDEISKKEKEVISSMCDYILEEVSK